MKRFVLRKLYSWFPVADLKVDHPYETLPGARGIRFSDGAVFLYGSIKYWFLRYTHS